MCRKKGASREVEGERASGCQRIREKNEIVKPADHSYHQKESFSWIRGGDPLLHHLREKARSFCEILLKNDPRRARWWRRVPRTVKEKR